MPGVRLDSVDAFYVIANGIARRFQRQRSGDCEPHQTAQAFGFFIDVLLDERVVDIGIEAKSDFPVGIAFPDAFQRRGLYRFDGFDQQGHSGPRFPRRYLHRHEAEIERVSPEARQEYPSFGCHGSVGEVNRHGVLVVIDRQATRIFVNQSMADLSCQLENRGHALPIGRVAKKL